MGGARGERVAGAAALPVGLPSCPYVTSRLGTTTASKTINNNNKHT